jgi:hypothetical protein
MSSGFGEKARVALAKMIREEETKPISGYAAIATMTGHDH